MSVYQGADKFIFTTKTSLPVTFPVAITFEQFWKANRCSSFILSGFNLSHSGFHRFVIAKQGYCQAMFEPDRIPDSCDTSLHLWSESGGRELPRHPPTTNLTPQQRLLSSRCSKKLLHLSIPPRRHIQPPRLSSTSAASSSSRCRTKS